MKFFSFPKIGVLGLLLLGHLASASDLPREKYAFPVLNPLVASVTSQVLGATEPFEQFDITPRADRTQTPLLENRNTIPLALFAQPGKSAPLAFLISGTGGGALEGSLLFLASELYRLGYHVITLPDPLSWQYALARSETGLPGYMPRDAKEYYQFLSEVTEELKSRQNLQVSGYVVGGYSYGGLLTAFLLKEDSLRHRFNFQKALAINPAIDISYGIRTLDSYYDRRKTLGPARCKDDLNKVVGIGEQLLKQGLDLDFLANALKTYNIQQDDLEYIIGESFRESLRDVIFTSQQVHDLGILTAPATTYGKNAREAEAYRFNFTQFLEKFVYPSVKQENREKVSVDEILKRSSLYAMADVLKSDPRFFVMENRDDFIVNAADLAFLKNTMGERLYLYPFGGHVGNLWFDRNVKDLAQIMKLPAR